MLRTKQMLPLLAFALAISAVNARANTYIVNSAASSNIGDCSGAGECPLGAAITAANNNPGPDTIAISRQIFRIQLTAPLPEITDSAKLTLNSEYIFGGNIERANDASSRFRLFTVAPGADFSITNINLSHGNVAGAGGAILNFGTLQMKNCRMSFNQADSGGAIANVGATAVLEKCDFVFNDGFDKGGAIVNSNTAGANGNLTLADCSAFGNGGFTPIGGMLFNEGTATFSGCGLSGNTADFEGGAIYNTGSLALIDSELSSNYAWNLGSNSSNGGSKGGAVSSHNGTVSVSGSNFSSNGASDYGGAVFAEGGSVTISNSTLSNNSADTAGSALYSAARVSVESSTITLNRNSFAVSAPVGDAGGSGNFLNIGNSIIAGNNKGDVEGSGGSGNALSSQGHNIVGQGGALALFNATGDQPGADPKLSALANNGGPTRTHAPIAGSPAINQGETDLAVDQRGSRRPQSGADDIGAFEGALTPIKVSLSPTAPLTNDILRATVTSGTTGDGATPYSYIWTNNGRTIDNSKEESFLDLSKPYTGDMGDTGDKGDRITVEVRVAGTDGGVMVGNASVTVANSAPNAISSQGTTPADVETAFELKGFDADGDALTYKRVGGPRNGVADIRVDPTDGKLKLFYKSRPFFNGVDIIRFVAIDNEGKTSNVSTLGINVLYTPPPPANRAPIAGDTNIDTYVNTSVIKGLLGSDPDGDALTFRIVGNAKYGKSEIKRDKDGQFKLFYTSLNRFYGDDAVTYIVTDSRGKDSNLATVRIHFINRAPLAQGNRIGVAAGAPVSQFLFGTDEDGDALTFRLVNNPRYGKGEIKLDEAGKWRFYYQSLPGYVGPDRITFIAIDPQGKQSPIATIDINVVRTSSTPSALTAGASPSGGNS